MISIYYFAFFFFIIYQRAPVIHTEEYPPAMIPAIRGRAISRIVVTPIIKRTNTMMKVVREV